MRSFREAADRLPASAMLTTTDIDSMRSMSAVFPNLEKLLSDYASYTSTPQPSIGFMAAPTWRPLKRAVLNVSRGRRVATSSLSAEP